MKTSNDHDFHAALAEGARVLAARRAELAVDAPPSSSDSAIDDEDAWLDDFIDLAPQAAPSGGRGSGPSAPGPMADDLDSLLKAMHGSGVIVAEDACPCGKGRKPVAAKVCWACEKAAVRAAYLQAGESAVPERFRGAAILNGRGEVACPEGKLLAGVQASAAMRTMLKSSGLIRGKTSRASMVLAALYADVLAAAKSVEVEGDTAWKGHPLVRRAARLRWLPAFAFETERSKGEAWIADLACRASILVIEDLVPETMAPAAATALGNTVRRRLHEGNPTIVTTSATPDELGRRLGASFEEALSAVTPVLDLTGVVAGQNTLNGHGAASMRLLHPR